MAPTRVRGTFSSYEGATYLLTAPLDELAAAILREFFGSGDGGSVSRRNTIASVCQLLGVGGPDRIATGRTVAEGWQLLELRGYICRDPEPSQGDWWFLTRAGGPAVNEFPRS